MNDTDRAHNAQVFGKIAAQYTDEYFDDTFDLPYIDKFLELLPTSGSVLDVACGPGMFAKYMHERGFVVHGTDLSNEMIRIARERVPNVHFEVMDMRNLHFPSESFDGLLVSYALIFIPSAETNAVLQEFYRLLKPGGAMLLIVQKGDADHIEHEPMKPDEELHVNFFQPESLSDQLKASGFSVELQQVIATPDTGAMSPEIIYAIAKKSEAFSA